LDKGVMTFAELKIADAMVGVSRSANEIAEICKLDPALTYRFLRMLTNVGDLVIEDYVDKKFRLGPMGELLCSNHPSGFASVATLQNSEAHWRAWSTLPTILNTGAQNGFLHAFGKGPFEYMEENPQYKQAFNAGMSGFSKVEGKVVVDSYKKEWGKFSTIVDIGGGHGYMLASILNQEAPKATGIILELNQVVQEASKLSTLSSLGVSDRCSHVVGSMFVPEDIPKDRDAYLFKRILHDWNDSECIKLLSNVAGASSKNSTLLVVDTVVPSDGKPHISKLMDVHMMCWGNGRERTREEFVEIYAKSGWVLTEILPGTVSGLSLIIGKKP